MDKCLIMGYYTLAKNAKVLDQTILLSQTTMFWL
jgi:hypothetical protein